MTQASLRGRLAGIAFIGGVCAALLIQVLLLALGVSTLIQNAPQVFFGLKTVGVIYLLFFAWQVYGQDLDNIQNTNNHPHSLGALFKKGAAINLTNPMTPIFLLMVLPNFVNPDNGSVFSQLIQLGCLLILIVFFVFSGFSVIGEKMGNRIFQSNKLKKMINRASALLMLVFAVILAIAEPPT